VVSTMETRCLLLASQRIKTPHSLRPLHLLQQLLPQRRHASNSSDGQKNPLGGYYESIISQPLPQTTSATQQPTTPSPPTSLPKTDKEEVLAKARVVFGSRLAGPAERKEELDRKSTLIAGVLVPPRPSEPDNCCMSGCVNCVWDRYRDELEEWAMARKAANHNLTKEKTSDRARRKPKKAPMEGTGLMLGEGEKGAQHTMVSMDDDGGGSETLWGTGLDADFTSEELFKDVPVGIREFMKQEKKLKEKHVKEGTAGG